jgi:hypothetical protein
VSAHINRPNQPTIRLLDTPHFLYPFDRSSAAIKRSDHEEQPYDNQRAHVIAELWRKPASQHSGNEDDG